MENAVARKTTEEERQGLLTLATIVGELITRGYAVHVEKDSIVIPHTPPPQRSGYTPTRALSIEVAEKKGTVYAWIRLICSDLLVSGADYSLDDSAFTITQGQASDSKWTHAIHTIPVVQDKCAKLPRGIGNGELQPKLGLLLLLSLPILIPVFWNTPFIPRLTIFRYWVASLILTCGIVWNIPYRMVRDTVFDDECPIASYVASANIITIILIGISMIMKRCG